MKKIYSLLLTATIATLSFAQAPQKMSYQAVIRDSENQLVVNNEVRMRISILQGSADGTAVYTETRTPVTNANGLVTFEIGGDGANSATGVLSAIDWSAGPYFIKTETDPSGGTSYTITGTSQLLSVPYALHSGSAEVLAGEITESQISDLQHYLTEEADPLFEASPASGIGTTDIANWEEAYSWGNHTEGGYLTEYVVTEDDVAAHQAALEITESQISDLGNYIETETDPLFTAAFDIQDPSEGDLLVFDGGKWVRVTPDFAATNHLHDTANEEDAGFMSSADKLKLNGIEEGAQVNVLTDWEATSGDAQLLNKPDMSLYAKKDMGNQNITNLAEPVGAQDAATKAYVDMLKTQVELMNNIVLEATGHGTLADIDGNIYKTVIIGSQIWMTENLRVTKYNNGDPITTGLNNSEWSNTDNGQVGAYAVYPHEDIDGFNSEAEVAEAYGIIYNWYVVDDPRGLCPAGWRVPCYDDWTELIDYVVVLGYPNEPSNSVTGNALKSCRQVDSPLGGNCSTTEHPRWDADVTHHGFDEFGFAALPGGYRTDFGPFDNVGRTGYWWSSTEFLSHNVYYFYMYHSGGSAWINGTNWKREGYSVRCMRDVD